MRPANFSKSRWSAVAAVLVALPLLVILSPLFLLAFIGYLVRALIINLTAWYVWRLKGKSVLLVYSDSTIWKAYFESELLPRLRDRAIVLNWSERKRWRLCVAVLAFRHYGGRIEFNPVALVFRPFGKVQVLRYYLPFKQYKCGDPASVNALTVRLLELTNARDVA
jgi:hypothetical protein